MRRQRQSGSSSHRSPFETEGENTRQFPAEKFLEALQTAIGAHGWVELGNREPLFLSSEQTLNLGSARGRLIIRGAPGLQPVIETELKDNKPFLTTGSGVSLELSGLTIKVRYPQKGVQSVPPPVITAAGSAKIDRCALIVMGGSYPKGSRAIFSNGGVLDVNRSWFQGFDETINVTAMNSTPAKIRQTMIDSNLRIRPGSSTAAGVVWLGGQASVRGRKLDDQK